MDLSSKIWCMPSIFILTRIFWFYHINEVWNVSEQIIPCWAGLTNPKNTPTTIHIPFFWITMHQTHNCMSGKKICFFVLYTTNLWAVSLFVLSCVRLNLATYVNIGRVSTPGTYTNKDVVFRLLYKHSNWQRQWYIKQQRQPHNFIPRIKICVFVSWNTHMKSC